MHALVYGQKGHNSISLNVEKKDINCLMGRNLKRLRLERQLTQECVAELLGISQGLIPKLEAGVKGMGKDILMRFCRLFNVRPYEFYIEPSTPMAENDQEMQHLLLYREARQLGLAEEIDRYTRYTVEHEKSRQAEAHDQHTSVHARARQTGKKRGQQSA